MEPKPIQIDNAKNHYFLAELMKFALAILFLVGVYFYASSKGVGVENQLYLILAAVVGAYMALNIGANDVANNVGPAVGSKALTMAGAITIAAIFEAMGALVAGGEVVKTIKKGIIDPSMISDPVVFIWLMTAALIAAGIWLNTATMVGAPVSTTHSIVGGVLGAGIAAGGWHIVDWQVMAKIASSWVISPLMGGLIAAGLLYLIKRTIYYTDNTLQSAKRIIPLLIGFMAWSFSSYLLIKGTKKLMKIGLFEALFFGFIIAAIVVFLVKPFISKAIEQRSGEKDLINDLFTIPLIFSSAVLSFSHGANDVANSVGPLAAINDAIISQGVSSKASIPLWVMLVGAVGLSIGLALYGPKLIHTVGTGITKINKTRAYCIAMAASITVIVASQLGLPISSTHVAVGAVFGVGFLREILNARYDAIIAEVKEQYIEDETDVKAKEFLDRFEAADSEEKSELLKELKKSSDSVITNKERKKLRKVHRQHLVQRSAFLKIIAAWFITVPCSALLSAIFYYALKGFFTA